MYFLGRGFQIRCINLIRFMNLYEKSIFLCMKAELFNHYSTHYGLPIVVDYNKAENRDEIQAGLYSKKFSSCTYT